MKKITLSAEARARIARQLAETHGVTVAVGSVSAAPQARDSDAFRL